MHDSFACLVLALGSLAAPATSQIVLFEDDFEQGASAWVLDGQWHSIAAGDPCGALVAPYPSPDGAMRWGDSSCGFGFGALAGNMSMASSVSLPASAHRITLSFWSYEDTECGTGAGCGWDWKFLYVSADGGLTWDFLGECYHELFWYQKSFDLTPYAGEDVIVRFRFDAVDFFINNDLGWIIDDVSIVAEPCSFSNYCTAMPNSHSATGAVMGHSGTKRIHLNDFVLTLDDAPPGQFAHFFYGPSIASTPVADGILCVGAGATGLVRLLPSGQIDAQGHLERHVDFATTATTTNWITPGSTWNFQCWYRDPFGGPTGSNFSDGLRVSFCP